MHLNIRISFTSISHDTLLMKFLQELGTEYLVKPLGDAEDEEHSSDFEPDENGEGAEDEEIDEDDDGDDDSAKAQSSSKRKRSGGDDEDDDDDDDDGDDDDDDGRPSKR